MGEMSVPVLEPEQEIAAEPGEDVEFGEELERLFRVPGAAGGASEAPEQEPAAGPGEDSAMSAPLVPADAPADEDSAGESEFHALRCRVLCVALLLGGLKVASYFATLFIGYHEVQDALQEVHRMAPEILSKKAAFVEPPGINAGYVMGLLANLLVPACGFFGAMHRSKKLVGCFCGCSGCWSCLGALALILYLGVQSAIRLAEPSLEDWLTACDPSPCMRLDTTALRVDCLAGGGWRTVAHGSIPHLPQDCPQVFLTLPEGQELPSDEPCMSPKAGEECEDPVRRAYCASMQDQACSPGNGLRKCVSFNGTETLLSCAPAGLPLRPEEVYAPNEKNVQDFAAAVKLAPEMIPRIQRMMKVNCLLNFPGLVLSCLGTCWGLSLYCKMSAGYATVGEPREPSFPGTQTSHVQPLPLFMLRDKVAE